MCVCVCVVLVCIFCLFLFVVGFACRSRVFIRSIIEDTAAMDRVAGEVAVVAARWGAAIEFIKVGVRWMCVGDRRCPLTCGCVAAPPPPHTQIQKVEAGSLASILAKKKNADLQATETIINAKATKQTAIIEAEGQRDKATREAEGEAQQIRSRARGQAKAIQNAATAEAQSIREVSRALHRAGNSASKYLLAVRYIDSLRRIASQPGSEVIFMPRETASLQSLSKLGANAVIARA